MAAIITMHERTTYLETIVRVLLRPVAAVAIAVLIGAGLVGGLGEDPVEVYGHLLRGALVGWPNLAVTLQQTSPLIFTGLAVAFAFRSGMWNVGVEGQLLMGGLVGGIIGYSVDLPALLHLPLTLIGAALGGMLWALFPGILRAYFNVNELVTCLMLNPVALLVTGYFSARVLKAPGPTNKLPNVLPSAQLDQLTLFSQLNTGIFIGLGLVALMAVFNFRTVKGFEWKWLGLNSRFAFYGGVNVRADIVRVMAVSGAIAGLGGAEQVLGVYRAFYDDFSPGYGFDGIAVAMLANFNPVFVAISAFLFGALASGSTILQMTTGISKHLVQVLQFVIVLLLSAQFAFTWIRKRYDNDGKLPGSGEPGENQTDAGADGPESVSPPESIRQR